MIMKELVWKKINWRIVLQTFQNIMHLLEHAKLATFEVRGCGASAYHSLGQGQENCWYNHIPINLPRTVTNFRVPSPIQKSAFAPPAQ